MKTRRTFLSMLGLSALVSAAAIAAPAAPEKATVGKPAPEFALKDVDGKTHKLSDYKGKIVVLQWVNPKCPVCERVATKGVLTETIKELKAIDKDYVHLAINSTYFQTPEITAAYLKDTKHPSVLGLDDRDGKVGHLYGAKTTPHMYVIDKEGVLRYAGAIDDDGRGKMAPGKATNYVVNAVKQIVAGDTVTPDTVKPYGCSVKYAKK